MSDETGAGQRRQEIDMRKAEITAVNKVNYCQKLDSETNEPVVVGGIVWLCPDPWDTLPGQQLGLQFQRKQIRSLLV